MPRVYKPKQFSPRIYAEWGELMSDLPDNVKLKIFEAIIKYPNIDVDSGVWRFIKSQIDKDYQNFIKNCAKNKENAKNYWGERTFIDRTTLDNERYTLDSDRTTLDNAREPKQITETKTETEIKEKNKKKKKAFVPPTLDEVKEFCQSRGIVESVATKIYDYYTVADWHDSNGKKIERWKAKIIAVWDKPENHIEPERPFNPDDPDHFKL